MAGLYIHIPFCKSKCAYCDFYSMPGHEAQIDIYIECLLSELRNRKCEIPVAFDTLYIGGGTPSVLSIKQLSRLIEGLSEIIELPGGEKTIEANPDDINPDFISSLRSLGFNRISIGVQTFVDTTLGYLNRRHDGLTARRALDLLSNDGWNFNADLIYGLPGENIDIFKRNLSTLISYNPAHISAYALMVEPGTRLWASLQAGKFSEATDEEFAEMYELLCRETASNGYNHYEISNFAKPGKEAVHNQRYWDFTPYVGIGAGAYSFDGRISRFNPDNLRQYINKVLTSGVAYTLEEESEIDRLNDYIFTSLRTSEGLSKSFLNNQFGKMGLELWENAIHHPDITSADGRAWIIEKKWLVSDAIIRDLLV